MKCKFIRPRKMYHPVFPYKSNTKLMFPLCSTCVSWKHYEDNVVGGNDFNVAVPDYVKPKLDLKCKST